MDIVAPATSILDIIHHRLSIHSVGLALVKYTIYLSVHNFVHPQDVIPISMENIQMQSLLNQ